MRRGRNQPNDYVVIAPALRDIGIEILAFEPALHLLIGPQGIGVLRKMQRHQAIRAAELVLLAQSLDSAAERGKKLRRKLSKSQREQLDKAAKYSGLVKSYSVLLELSPEDAIRVIETLRKKNPVAEATIELEPTNENAMVLAERVVGLYEPVFQWEPSLEVQKDVMLGGRIRPMLVVLKGDAEDVANLVETIRLTLGANNYRGTFDADVRRVANPGATRMRNRLLA